MRVACTYMSKPRTTPNPTPSRTSGQRRSVAVTRFGPGKAASVSEEAESWKRSSLDTSGSSAGVGRGVYRAAGRPAGRGTFYLGRRPGRRQPDSTPARGPVWLVTAVTQG